MLTVFIVVFSVNSVHFKSRGTKFRYKLIFHFIISRLVSQNIFRSRYEYCNSFLFKVPKNYVKMCENELILFVSFD